MIGNVSNSNRRPIQIVIWLTELIFNQHFSFAHWNNFVRFLIFFECGFDSPWALANVVLSSCFFPHHPIFVF